MYASKQKGFTLIEALVAFLIISVGMLGIASLQMLSLKSGHTAALRTLAVIKTEEILERMRSNNSVLKNYDAAGAGTDNGCNDHGGPIVQCSEIQMAADDMFNWKDGLSKVFPVGTTSTVGVISPTPAQPLSEVTITINWQERASKSQVLLNMNYTTSLLMFCDTTKPTPSC